MALPGTNLAGVYGITAELVKTKSSSLAGEYLRAQLGTERAIDPTIHPNDEMLCCGGDFTAQTPDDMLTLYFRNGFEMARTIEQIVQWRLGSFQHVNALLDFASGYGRLTRHLVTKLPKERITVSDIVAEAMEFQRTQFGVNAIVSATNPHDFVCDQRFDVIFAASLFTHMPRATFGAWLHRLRSLLTPRGVLIFNTHSVETFEWSTGVLPAGGDFVFDAARVYSRFLEPDDYGNTYVTQAALREIAGPHALLHLPRGLSNGQDLNVLVDESDCDFASLRYDYDPVAMVDCATIHGSTLRISGWAGTRSRDCRIEHVSLEIGGRPLAEFTSLFERPDVAAYFQEEGFRHSGWACTIDLSEHPVLIDDVLVLKATGACGFEWVSHAGTMLAAALRPPLATAMQDARDRAAAARAQFEEREAALQARIASLEEDAARLEATICTMEASRFWKMRNEWFRVKASLTG